MYILAADFPEGKLGGRSYAKSNILQGYIFGKKKRRQGFSKGLSLGWEKPCRRK